MDRSSRTEAYISWWRNENEKDMSREGIEFSEKYLHYTIYEAIRESVYI